MLSGIRLFCLSKSELQRSTTGSGEELGRAGADRARPARTLAAARVGVHGGAGV